MTTATAADYGWIRSSSSPFSYPLESGYTLVLVRGVSPAELLAVAGAEPRGVCEGLDELIEQHLELIDESDGWDACVLAGACTVPGEEGDWTLALALGGDFWPLGFMETLSAGSRVVTHSSNGGKPMHFFHWYENGELRTEFEWPTVRRGSSPDELNSLICEVGLGLTDEEASRVDRKAAVFALAERLTGVRVTAELLKLAEYQTAEMPEEPAEEWKGVIIDITDAHGVRTYVNIKNDG
ncbi:DUF6461 domain-containing protein [Streptomyces sp. W16]|uniref:DUF6461 domain-containing protein n=1 Tax=Streptomyces sp. W16 TaxID=3076631 RepID=UPI00295AE1C9|nr:DUF6461 domain-containing protein [Streptomyces sp. W16]MDV9169421.1 DUF6461 domain-containing protein [Streptomyces sp. W16]